ncbi:MAG: hypothetical protein RLY66_357 [Candidatus Parcubacteria bacterium]|jgi:biotin operon repressor
MAKVNPFTPNNPAHAGMFIGRTFELDSFDKALTQTKHSNPTHLLLLGERGIGKTSLINVAQMFARGEFTWGELKHNFLPVRLSLDENISLVDFVLHLKSAIEREINKENPEIGWFKAGWEFLSRFEVAGVTYKKEESLANSAQLIQKCIYSLIDTVKTLKTSKIAKQKEGIIILLDEADKAPDELCLGSFLKKLSESLIAENQNNILFILTGLPNLREVLIKSHESSLRLFQELSLKPLSIDETEKVIMQGLKEAENTSGIETLIDQDAKNAIFAYSEGYPHFVQQIGFSVFDADADNVINKSDVEKGFFMKNGALEMIGDRYYAKMFYGNINVESQREILKIMSEKWNDFVSREEIKKKFSGNEITLTNGIRALTQKGIIIPKDGAKGVYRLQWASFAFWIKSHDKAKHR